MNIKELIKEPESQSLEFRKDLPSRLELAKLLCAFSNLSGGNLIVGVDPRSREVLGLSKTKIFDLQEYFRKIVYSLVEPIPSYFIKIVSYDDKKILDITVLPGNLKPYMLKGKDKLQGTFVRSGKYNQLASPQMIAELERQAMNISFDSTPAFDCTVEDIDKDLIQYYINKREELYSIPKALVNYAFLEKNSFIVREGGQIYPTVGAILCFCDKASDYFPKARIKLKKYEYDDRSRLVEIKTFTGSLINQYQELLNYFKPVDLPLTVFKELLMNAIIHRDYSFSNDMITVSQYNDRLEVLSPGFLPAGLTINDLNSGVGILRNKFIYKIFSEYFKLYESGSGVQNINKILKDNNLKPVEYTENNNNLLTNISFEFSEDFISREEQKILDYLEQNEYINNNQCQKLLRLKGKQAQYLLTKLVKKGKLISIGEKKGRRYQIKK